MTKTTTTTKLLLITLLAMSAYSSKAGECCTTCISGLKTDRFARVYHKGLPDVETFDSPLKPTDTNTYNPEGFCGAYWDKNGGTCCDQASLEARADDLYLRMRDDAAEMNSLISEEVTKGIVEGLTKVKEFISDSRDEIEAFDGVTTEDVDSFIEGLDEIQSDFTAHPDRQTKAKDNANKCFKEYMEIRYTGLCMRCSGAASFFYDPVKKAYKVKRSFCQRLIKSCIHVHAYSGQISLLTDFLIMIRGLFAGEAEDESEYVEDDGAILYEVEALEECADDVDACVEDNGLVDFVCSTFTLNSANAKFEPDSEAVRTASASTQAIKENKKPHEVEKPKRKRKRKSEKSDKAIEEGKADYKQRKEANKTEKAERNTRDEDRKKKVWTEEEKTEEKGKKAMVESATKKAQEKAENARKEFVKHQEEFRETKQKAEEMKALYENSGAAKTEFTKEKVAKEAEKTRIEGEKTQEDGVLSGIETELTTKDSEFSTNCIEADNLTDDDFKACDMLEREISELLKRKRDAAKKVKRLAQDIKKKTDEIKTDQDNIDDWEGAGFTNVKDKVKEKFDSLNKEDERKRKEIEDDFTSAIYDVKSARDKASGDGVSASDWKKYEDEQMNAEKLKEAKQRAEQLHEGVGTLETAAGDACRAMKTAMEAAKANNSSQSLKDALKAARELCWEKEEEFLKANLDYIHEEMKKSEYEGENSKHKEDVFSDLKGDLDDSITEVDTEISDIESNLQGTDDEAEREKFKKQLERLHEQKRSLTKSSQDYESDSDTLTQEQAKFDKEKMRRSHEKDKYLNKLREIQAEKERMELENTINEHVDEITQLRTQKQALTQAFENAPEGPTKIAAKAALDEWRANLDMKEQERRKKQNKVEFLKKKRAEAEIERGLEELDGELVELEEEISEIEFEKSEIAAKVAHRKRVSAEIAAEAAVLKDSLRNASEEEKPAIQAEIEALFAENSVYSRETDELEAEVEDLTGIVDEIDILVTEKMAKMKFKMKYFLKKLLGQVKLLETNANTRYTALMTQVADQDELAIRLAAATSANESAVVARIQQRIDDITAEATAYETWIAALGSVKGVITAALGKAIPENFVFPKIPPLEIQEIIDEDQAKEDEEFKDFEDEKKDGETSENNEGGNNGSAVGGKRLRRLLTRVKKMTANSRRNVGAKRVYTKFNIRFLEGTDTDGYGQLESDDVNGADPDGNGSGKTVGADEMAKSQSESQENGGGNAASLTRVFIVLSLILVSMF